MFHTSEVKKSKRTRHDYTAVELDILLAEHARCPYPNRERRKALAFQLGVSETSVLYWFQNRRRADRNQGKSLSSNCLHRRKPYDRPTTSSPGNSHSLVSSNSSMSLDVTRESDWSVYHPNPEDQSCQLDSAFDYYSAPMDCSSYQCAYQYPQDWYYAQFSSPSYGHYAPPESVYPTDCNQQFWNCQGWYPSFPAMNNLPTFDVPFPVYEGPVNQQDWQQQQGNYYDSNGYYC